MSKPGKHENQRSITEPCGSRKDPRGFLSRGKLLPERAWKARIFHTLQAKTELLNFCNIFVRTISDVKIAPTDATEMPDLDEKQIKKHLKTTGTDTINVISAFLPKTCGYRKRLHAKNTSDTGKIPTGLSSFGEPALPVKDPDPV